MSLKHAHNKQGHGHTGAPGHKTNRHPAELGADTATDPVCGMTVDPHAGKPSAEHAGATYHFCCEGCRTKFLADPAAYLTSEDPVCGMSVDRASAQHMAKHAGERFYFCSTGCHDKFVAEPGKYLDGRPAPEPLSLIHI